MNRTAARGALTTAFVLLTLSATTSPSTAAPVEENPQPGTSSPDSADDSGTNTEPLKETERAGTGGRRAEESGEEKTCKARAVYEPKARHGEQHEAVGVTQANHNGTSQLAQSTFVSEATGQVGVTVTGHLGLGVDAMIGRIEKHFHVSLSPTIMAKVGNMIMVPTPPKTTTYAEYGVYRLKTTGVSYTVNSDCSISDKNKVTSYTPWRVGWNLWEK